MNLKRSTSALLLLFLLLLCLFSVIGGFEITRRRVEASRKLSATTPSCTCGGHGRRPCPKPRPRSRPCPPPRQRSSKNSTTEP
ncbi:unnamed protein product [Arabidopsis halleri]